MGNRTHRPRRQAETEPAPVAPGPAAALEPRDPTGQDLAPPEPHALTAARLDQLDKLEQTIRWIVAGASFTEVIRAIQAAWPTLDAAATFQAAANQLRTAGTADPDLVRGYCIEGARDIYRRCIEAGDMPSAMKALRLLATFYPPPDGTPR